MSYVRWEPPIDFTWFDRIDHFECGEDKDVIPNFSEVTDLGVSISAFDSRGSIVNIDVWLSTFNPAGLCKVTGQRKLPWGFANKFLRYELYNDDLMQHEEMVTNKAGEFFFFGTPGQRIKVKFEDDKNFYWFMIPDKATITFDDLASSYGYAVRQHQFVVNSIPNP